MAKPVLSEKRFQDETAAFAYVEAALWPDGPVCPFCGTYGDKIGRLNGKTTRPGLCKCYNCKKPFTVRMGTIFESSHLPLRFWLQVIHLMNASKKGISTNEVQRLLKCSMKTAWHLTHRIREMMAPGGELEPLGGKDKVVEADATFIGGKERNKHIGKRNPKSVGGLGKAPVHSLVERDGRVRSHHVATVHSYVLKPIIMRHIAGTSTLVTDTAGAYGAIGRKFARHESVNHAWDEYVRRMPDSLLIHTNSVENYFSILKRGIYGCYFHVSEAHLHRYLAEFDFRYSNRIRLGIDDVSRADRALLGAKGKRLTYRTTRGERTPEQSAP